MQRRSWRWTSKGALGELIGNLVVSDVLLAVEHHDACVASRFEQAATKTAKTEYRQPGPATE